ncbi:ribosome recycling factor [Buchnera aphidicola (Formosaphis micheliae)]|uniref:ribosome recycling factor n=1 Tax=Buchnera aphidicola TaxID=9 RepID=UPI0031B87213
MFDNIKKNTINCMDQCISVFKNNIMKIRTNRIAPYMLDGIYIEYYGTKTPVSQLSSITVENFNTLKINVFDASTIKPIEQEIINSNIGLYPSSNGLTIRVSLPALTESRRKDLIKILQHEGENSRISIRNIRRDINNKIKNLFKNKSISEDQERRFQSEIQKITDNFIKKSDYLLAEKKKDLMII